MVGLEATIASSVGPASSIGVSGGWRQATAVVSNTNGRKQETKKKRIAEILHAELTDGLSIPVDAIEPEGLANLEDPSRCLVVALPMRAAAVRRMIPLRTSFMALRLRSVAGSLEGQPRPAPNALVSIVSGSFEFRHSSREVLTAVGLDPECLCEIDTTIEGWMDRAASGALVIADAVAARALPASCQAKVYRVVADSCIAELKRLCEP